MPGTMSVDEKMKAPSQERWREGFLQFRDEDTRHVNFVRMRDIEVIAIQGKTEVWIKTTGGVRMRVQRGSLEFDVPVSRIEAMVTKAVGEGL